MILSDRDIRQALKEGKIKVKPTDGLERRIGPDGIDFRLGHTFLVFERNKQPYIDPRRKEAGSSLVGVWDVALTGGSPSRSIGSLARR